MSILEFLMSSGRGYLLVGWSTVVLLVAGFGFWAVSASIDSAVMSQGTVKMSEQRRIVQHPIGGRVSKVNVSEGDFVQAGQLLLVLDHDHLTSELAVLEVQLREILARKSRLEAERDGKERIVFPEEILETGLGDPQLDALLVGQTQLFEARLETLQALESQLKKRSSQLESQLTGLNIQRNSIEEQVRLILAELAKQEGLFEKGLTQSAVVLALQRERARLEGSLGEAHASIAQARGQDTELKLELVKVHAQRRESAIAELREVAPVETEIRERIRTIFRDIEGHQVSAPIPGKVLTLNVSAGSVLRPAEPALHLVPTQLPLSIAASVEPDEIESVSIGQEVKLVFSSIRRQDAHELNGKVKVVSADAVTDQVTGRPFFAVEISLADADEQKAQEMNLVPGIPVEVYFSTGSSSPINYLIEPFANYFRRAMREQ